MIDSHCHLDHEPLVQNIEDILANCKKEGVQKLLTISTTLNGFPKILEIIDKDEMIFGTYGIHPHETNNDQVSKDEIIKKINTNNKIIGVGESGLDFYYNNSDKDKQIVSFKNHIDAALELDIPLIVHSRNAEVETYEILKKSNKNLKILMHCFTGSLSFALIRRAMIRKMPYSRFTINWEKIVQLRDEEYSYKKYKRKRAYHNKSFKYHFINELESYNNAVFDNQRDNLSYNDDVFNLCQKLKADIIYLDPPYAGTMNNYFRFYGLIDSFIDSEIKKPFENNFNKNALGFSL